MPEVRKSPSATPVASPAVIWDKKTADTRKGKRVNAAQATLLWIDDFEPGLTLYKQMFEDLGFRVLTASCGEAGLQLAALHDIDVAVTDYEMPGMSGLAVAEALKAVKPNLRVLLFSGSTLVPSRAHRVVDGFCDKAGSRTALLDAIQTLLHSKASRRLQPPVLAQASDHGQRAVA